DTRRSRVLHRAADLRDRRGRHRIRDRERPPAHPGREGPARRVLARQLRCHQPLRDALEVEHRRVTAPRRASAPRLAPDERRRQLLDVACIEFAERGFYSTAMDDLALAAGVTKPGSYQHFPSKRALYVARLED